MNRKNSRRTSFVVSTSVLLISIFLQFYLSQLTSYDSDRWLEIKDPMSLAIIILSLVGIAASIVTIAGSNKRVHKYISALYILALVIIVLFSIVTIAVSGVGFLG